MTRECKGPGNQIKTDKVSTRNNGKLVTADNPHRVAENRSFSNKECLGKDIHVEAKNFHKPLRQRRLQPEISG